MEKLLFFPISQFSSCAIKLSSCNSLLQFPVPGLVLNVSSDSAKVVRPRLFVCICICVCVCVFVTDLNECLSACRMILALRSEL